VAGFWKRLFGDRTIPQTSLLDYAENYLLVFEVGSDDEKDRHGKRLLDAADATARHAGANDFVALLEKANIIACGQAAIFSAQRFDEIYTTSSSQEGYWLSTYALTHLMVLNRMKSLEDTPRAKRVADNAAHLYSGAYAVRKMLGKS
jgi:hypothetical protein